MTQHDKERELVELDNYLRDPSVGLPWEIRIKIADLITAQAEENRRLREALQAERSLSDRLAGALEYIDDYALSYPDLGVVSAVAQPSIQDHYKARAALSSTGEKG
ncbi:hypothetical protein [Paracoccus sp. AS002]|uniref:hypothetical protein n=1 Tax=Paracoccus sp. AS002 TaxID=3019545 RepID=UPI0023E8587F|nr:hypothetical protein [Paracoccus sp. AS002]MDF3904648.1 hypothetical protein [Paracoccus sp. AS002]